MDMRMSLESRAGMVTLTLALLLAGAMLYSLTIGPYPIPPGRVLTALWQLGGRAPLQYADADPVVVGIVRLPRVLGVTLSGMALALSGAALQGVFRNPLVGPELIGVSAGAAFGGVLAIMLAWPMVGVLGMAFAVGMLAVGMAFILASLAGRGSLLAMILAGVVCSGFFGALTGLAQYLADPQVQLPAITYWLLGSFVGMTYAKVLMLALVALFAGGVLLALRWRINLLSLGETDAVALGVRLAPLRWSVVGLGALLVAAQVSVSGGVGWVGLIVPHLARGWVGPEHGRLLPASALLGGLFLLLADDLARSLATVEIPIGLLTALVGTPVFAVLLWRLHGRETARD